MTDELHTETRRESPIIVRQNQDHDSELRGLTRESERGILALLFVGVVSVVFAGLFEWGSYDRLVGLDTIQVSTWTKAAIFGLLCGKSLLAVFPLVLVVVGFLFFGWNRMATLFLVGGTVLVFYWMAADLTLASVTGNHLIDYVPYLEDMWRVPEKNYGHWVGQGVVTEAATLALIVLCSVTALFLVTRWLFRGIAAKWRFVQTPVRPYVTTLVFVVVLLATNLAPAVAISPSLLQRFYTVTPISADFVHRALDRTAKEIGRWTGLSNTTGLVGIMSVDIPSFAEANKKPHVTLKSFATVSLQLDGWRLQDFHGNQLRLKGGLKPNEIKEIDLPARKFFFGPKWNLTLMEPRGLAHYVVDPSGGRFLKNSGSDALPSGSGHSAEVDREISEGISRLQREAEVVGKGGASAVIKGSRLPNVLLVIMEGVGAWTVSPTLLKRLDAWSQKGLRLDRHYSGSNCSHLGIFSLLFGNNSIFYDRVLDKRTLPQMCLSLRLSGYYSRFMASGEFREFLRMDEYINDKSFDEVTICEDVQFKDFRGWPEADRKTLHRVSELLNSRSDQPQFVVAYTYGTHFPYAYPPEFAVHKPCGEYSPEQGGLPRGHGEEWANRYKNAVLFLEDELMQLIESLDPSSTVIMVTSDHGESVGQDGLVGHCSRASDTQTRVPFLMVGPGIAPGRVASLTSHVDIVPTLLYYLAGEPVPLPNSGGRIISPDSLPTGPVFITLPNWRKLEEVVMIGEYDRALFRMVIGTEGPLSVTFVGMVTPGGQFVLAE
jgi:hypothetical protein